MKTIKKTILLLAIIILVLYIFSISKYVSYKSSTKKEPNQQKQLKKIKRLPNAIIIGVQNCGTTALTDFLMYHPNVAIPGGERHYFNEEKNYVKGVEWYRSKMRPSFDNQIVMEKTPDYFPLEKVPKRVFDLNPEMKLIVIACDPVRRTVSNYLHQKWYFSINYEALDNHLTKLFRKYRRNLNDTFVFTENFKHESFVNSMMFSYGLYYKHVQNWLKYFSKENILFLNGEQFKRDPYVEFEKIQSFLNIESLIGQGNFVFNQKKGFYCIKNSITNKTRCEGNDKGRKHPHIDANILDDIRKLYEPENKKFFEFLNEAEPWWKI